MKYLFEYYILIFFSAMKVGRETSKGIFSYLHNALWSRYLIFINVGKSFYLITFGHEATIISDWHGIKGEGKVEIRIWSFLYLLSCSYWFQYEIRFYNLTLANLSDVQTSAREFSHGQKSWLLALT